MRSLDIATPKSPAEWSFGWQLAVPLDAPPVGGPLRAAPILAVRHRRERFPPPALADAADNNSSATRRRWLGRRRRQPVAAVPAADSITAVEPLQLLLPPAVAE